MVAIGDISASYAIKHKRAIIMSGVQRKLNATVHLVLLMSYSLLHRCFLVDKITAFEFLLSLTLLFISLSPLLTVAYNADSRTLTNLNKV